MYNVEYIQWILETYLKFISDFSVLHILGYCFNFYHVSTQPVSFLCVFDEVYFR